MKKRLARGISILLCGALLIATAEISAPPAKAAEQSGTYQQRFMTMWDKIHDPQNGYFSEQGIPYHSVEALMCEAPDYGHETTSEAFSYYIWLEAMYGNFTGNWSPFQTAWDKTETYMIPSDEDQLERSMGRYNPQSPATLADEGDLPSEYPEQMQFGAAVGSDPINSDLYNTYHKNTVYGMHWLLDVDNWYGFGQRGDGVSKPSYMNTFQRGPQESVWETIPQPCWDDMTFGGPNGYLDLFTGDNSYAKQFKYTDAPDADARAVQATYDALLWSQGSGIDLSDYLSKASEMGDYLRYAMFDKYFRKIGSPNAAGTGYDAAHYLLSWYYAWGGALDGGWSWKIGCSHNHFGYQNPLAAYALSSVPELEPASANGATDWGTSLSRQLEFYQWLQSSEGAIAGGASNSSHGRYEAWPAGTSTFYGMGYEENPVYHDPGSNTWFGMQAWSMQRVAEYYYRSGDARAKAILDKWVPWVQSVVHLNGDGTFEIPNKLDWSGQPDTWTGSYTGNPNLHVTVRNYGVDLGIAASLANTLLYYSAGSGDDDSRVLAKELLDRMWNNYQDDKGLAVPEIREDYSRFFDPIYVPDGWTGTMPNGDVIQPGDRFIDIRTKYKDDPQWQTIVDAHQSGTAPTLTYHRFWAECDIALAYGVYADLFEGTTNASISPKSAQFDKKTGQQEDVTVDMTLNGTQLSGISNNGVDLTEGTDYTATDTQVVVSKNYLAEQPVGTTNLVFTFSAGKSQTLNITVIDSTTPAQLDPSSGGFDKNPSAAADIAVTLIPNGNTFTGIRNGTEALTEDRDYAVSGSTVTLLKDYLSQLPMGSTDLTFEFSAGAPPVFTVHVTDSRGSVEVEMFNSDRSAQTNTLSPKFRITNKGSASIDLSQLKLRYYYTADGSQAQNFYVDWASFGSNNVSGSFVPMTQTTGADGYLEISLGSGAGSLEPNRSVEIQTRVAKSDWSSYTQTNDYSFNSSASSYADWDKVTAYLGGGLVWGSEP